MMQLHEPLPPTDTARSALVEGVLALAEVDEDDEKERQEAMEALLRRGWALGERIREFKRTRPVKSDPVDPWLAEHRLPAHILGRTLHQQTVSLSTAPKVGANHFRNQAKVARVRQESTETPAVELLTQIFPGADCQALMVTLGQDGQVIKAHRTPLVQAVQRGQLIPEDPSQPLQLFNDHLAVLPVLPNAGFAATLIGCSPKTDPILHPLRLLVQQMVAAMPARDENDTFGDRTVRCMERVLDMAERTMASHLPARVKTTLAALLFTLEFSASATPAIPNFVTMLSDPYPLKGKKATRGYRILTRAFTCGILGRAYAGQLVIMFMRILDGHTTTYQQNERERLAEERKAEEARLKAAEEMRKAAKDPGQVVMEDLEAILEDDMVEVVEANPRANRFVFRLVEQAVSFEHAMYYACQPVPRPTRTTTQGQRINIAWGDREKWAEENEGKSLHNFTRTEGGYVRSWSALRDRFDAKLEAYMTIESAKQGLTQTVTLKLRGDAPPEVREVMGRLVPYTRVDFDRMAAVHSLALGLSLETGADDDMEAHIAEAWQSLYPEEEADYDSSDEEKEDEDEDDEKKDEESSDEEEEEDEVKVTPELDELATLPFRAKLQKIEAIAGFPILELWKAAGLDERQLVALASLYWASAAGEAEVEPVELMDLAKLADLGKGLSVCSLMVGCNIVVDSKDLVPCDKCKFCFCVDCCEGVVGSAVMQRGKRLSKKGVPYPQCRTPLPEHFFRRVLEENKMLEPLSALPENDDFFFCGNGDDCKCPTGKDTIHTLPPIDEEDAEFVRQQCGAAGDEEEEAKHTIRCEHCERYLATQRNEEDYRAFTAQCEREGTVVRRSPCCGRPAILAEACFHMTCVHCVNRRDVSAHWCWHCGVQFPTGRATYDHMNAVVREERAAGRLQASIYNLRLIPNEWAAERGFENLSRQPIVRRVVAAVAAPVAAVAAVPAAPVRRFWDFLFR